MNMYLPNKLNNTNFKELFSELKDLEDEFGLIICYRAGYISLDLDNIKSKTEEDLYASELWDFGFGSSKKTNSDDLLNDLTDLFNKVVDFIVINYTPIKVEDNLIETLKVGDNKFYDIKNRSIVEHNDYTVDFDTLINTLADYHVFSTNKFSNNNDEAGDNLNSFIVGAKTVLKYVENNRKNIFSTTKYN